MKNKSKELKIVEDIFCLSGILTAEANKKVFSKHKLTLSLYIPLQMIKYGLKTVTDMRKFSTETAAGLGKKISTLEGLSMVKRKLDQDDKRKWIFELTLKGKKVLSVAEKDFDDLARSFYAGFTIADKKKMEGLINSLEKNLKK